MTAPTAVTRGELVGPGSAPPPVDLTHELKFPESQVYATDSSGRSFRVTEVREHLFTDRAGQLRYWVTLVGPRTLKSGADHARHKCVTSFGGRNDPDFTDIPAAVCDYLYGEDRMRRLEGTA